jgi:MFS transporter, ACS family, glucarate transporter
MEPSLRPDLAAAAATASSAARSRAAAPGRTHVRHRVLAMTMVLGAITYLDRVTISVTRPDVARDLNLSATQMGYVFSAFYLAYALFEIPTGWY